MLNVEEFVCPELRVAVCHVKEAAKAVLHTIVVCRSIGGTVPMDPSSVYSDLLDLTYMRTDEPVVEQSLEDALRQAAELFEGRTRAQLTLSFFTRGKRSIWGLLLGDEKVVFEQWRLPVLIRPPRRFSNPADNLREEADLQTSASAQVQQALLFVVGKVNYKVEHLPPPSDEGSYEFEVSLECDGKSLIGAPARPLIGTSLSKTIKHLPYMA
uniref:Autophagy-related protein 101 n=1 Tax=Noctiluca scintillans TaxID=2966 RepID=A0A7S1FD89_NOCSC|mmetsp:Transcript_5413/g.15491  ORF Transcript_5413/g.15491 Transcript_5413/m.15491 type:complete len:212 (+) Transcript_5413:66-701(+)